MGAVQSVQRRRAELPESVSGPRVSGARDVRAAVDGVRDRRDAKPPYAQNWNLERAALAVGPLPRRGALRRREGLAAAAQRRGEPGGLRAGRDRAERRSPPHLRQLSRRRRHLRLLDHRDADATSPARPTTPDRRACRGATARARLQRVVLVFEVARLSVGDEPLGRGGQAARRRERPRAESLRSRRRVRPVAVRRAASFRRERELGAAPAVRCARRRCARSSAAGSSTSSPTHNSGTPFTVSDSANVSLQANSPPISGFAASRPNLVGDPNGGPRTVDAWISRSAFQRLNPQTQAGQFGDAGRNIARGPAYTNVDLSLVRTFSLSARTRLQFRAEAFNIANHANFGLPVADLNSANFGRILSAGPPRLLQFGMKLMF